MTANICITATKLMTVLEAILKIKQDREAQNRYPTYALLKEIYALVPAFIANEELEQLIADGVVRIGETVNHEYVELK